MPTKYTSADQYANPKYKWQYTFPIYPMHRDYGRLEIYVELLPGRDGRTYDRLLLWFGQTDDTRYTGKVFKIPLPKCEGLTTFSRGNGRCVSGIFDTVWRVNLCPEHKQAVLNAYAPDTATALMVSAMSSTTSVWFTDERKGE